MPKAPPSLQHARDSRLHAEPYARPPPMATPSSESTLAAHERPSTAWSADDDRMLMQYRQQGLNWGPIAEHFPGKTPNACRKRHERLMERKNTNEWDTIKTEDLANAYFACREPMWRILADHLGESKWQTLETKCMEKGFKNLQTAARGARRASSQGRYGSPHESTHLSDTGDASFDDSGMGPELASSRQHTPPHVLLPPPRESPPSRGPSPARNPSQAVGYPYGGAAYPRAASLEAPRPPVLAATGNTAYAYPSYTSQAQAYASAAAYPATGWAAVPNAATTSAGQRLPSITQEFNFLPPVNFGGVRSNHIATSTYG